jgi:hypothetical protein
MKNEVLTYTQRPRRYKNVDGVGDMFFGLSFLGFALSMFLERLLPAGATSWAHGSFGLYAGLVPAVGLWLWLRWFIRRHWTWRRTGYVAYRRGPKWWVVVAASAPIGALVCWVLALVWRHFGMGLSLAIMWALQPVTYALWILFTTREHLWKWLVFLIMALGLVGFGLAVQGDFERVAWQMFLFLGLMWTGSGVGTLFSYIRHTQPAESQAQ